MQEQNLSTQVTKFSFLPESRFFPSILVSVEHTWNRIIAVYMHFFLKELLHNGSTVITNGSYAVIGTEDQSTAHHHWILESASTHSRIFHPHFTTCFFAFLFQLLPCSSYCPVPEKHAGVYQLYPFHYMFSWATFFDFWKNLSKRRKCQYFPLKFYEKLLLVLMACQAIT